MKKIFNFYKEGFQNLTVGKSLWTIIFIKLFIMFGIFKVFFFSDTLNSRYDTQEQKQQHILYELTERKLPEEKQ